MSLLSDIRSDLKQAMLDKNVLVRDTIRMFLSEVQKFEIDSKEEANDAKALQIINKMIKQRNDSIEQFKKGGRDDLVAKELSEVDVLNKYKPAQLSEDEIVLKVREAISSSEASSMQDIGKVMGLLKNTLSGSADMGLVSRVVKDQLS
ncbi:GatB/YqeY domain-containing protein [Gammaproteobacteria bacterium]|nr:GatB/YqeY domain-containing protein [Gammaproteobacteria bacterium]MDA9143072.1 GatB/YqeY domain-containing protein [Gammaproteobacteria bacterium]MDA9997189.1 GatB/YqeY domain-containing protein [Gammaproteobacteria bacterium]MDC0367371.1 GatB/YqeY domain-containing protein [Gammaproteobacteria bacterium]MDC1123779.1 GatB/YqeY domain-containing protein [Gammaproteobacteria bacterium]